MSYRKEHQSVIHQGDYAQNKENYEFQNAVDFTNISSKQLELLWKETLKRNAWTLFSMYEDGQAWRYYFTRTSIQKIQIIKPYTKWVRSFLVSKEMSIFPIATQNGMKTLVGAWK
jgi:hypothetical protein